MPELVFTPTDFVALLNQTLEYAYPSVIIEGELANFRISKNKWVYFDLKDELSSVAFFGAVYQLPGPLQDGITVRAVGVPRLHQRFGFNINLQSLVPIGEGALKKAAMLLMKKLAAEGLFLPERKRPLPQIPMSVGLVTSAASAAYADFIKILNERWGGIEINLADSLVQGDQAPLELTAAIEHINALAEPPEVLVITRGGGSADDLAAFSDERVVRAVALSRIPTLVAIGHEVDESLAELAADARASTPSNAAALLVPDRRHELANVNTARIGLSRTLIDAHVQAISSTAENRTQLFRHINNIFTAESERLNSARRLVLLFDPRAALKRGYAIVSKGGHNLRSVKGVKKGDNLRLKLSDGTILSEVMQVNKSA